MKPLIFLIAIFGTSPSFDRGHVNTATDQDKCKAMLDSANVLVRTGVLSVNWEPRIIDKEREFAISRWFQSRSFSELTCLLESDNKLYRLYGYMMAAELYGDSMKNKYSYFFTDTTSVQYNTEEGLVDTKQTLGEILRSLTDRVAEDNNNMNKRPEIETKVSLFIKEYAQYPNSYKLISFPHFGIGSDNDGLTNFNIRHQYEIRNNQGQIVNITSAFVLSPQLNIYAIEQDSSSYISAHPPILKDWFKSYGRKLDANDSITLNLKWPASAPGVTKER